MISSSRHQSQQPQATFWVKGSVHGTWIKNNGSATNITGRLPLADEGDDCPICLDPLSLVTSSTLPCGHVFHPACVEGLRTFGVNQVCPMCRTELPAGPKQLHDEGARLFFPILSRVDRGCLAWNALPPAEQRQMDDVVERWTKAAHQGYTPAQYNLGSIIFEGRGVPQSDIEAVRWWRKAADQGDSDAQFNLGIMLFKGKGTKQDRDEAIIWWQTAADQGLADAQLALAATFGKKARTAE